jgi:hypothetical protein
MIFPNHVPRLNICLMTGHPSPVSKSTLCCVGLQQFVAQAQLQEAVQMEVPAKTAPTPRALGEGNDTIYVGKGQYIQVLFLPAVICNFLSPAVSADTVEDKRSGAFGARANCQLGNHRYSRFGVCTICGRELFEPQLHGHT